MTSIVLISSVKNFFEKAEPWINSVGFNKFRLQKFAMLLSLQGGGSTEKAEFSN